MEGTVKYYNNKPVIVLKKHEEADFYQVLVNLEIQNVDLDFIAESFRGCHACMVGHKSTCHCDDEVDKAYDVIERIMENYEIKDENLFYVPVKDLKDKPFEWAENEKLKAQITTNKNILNGLIDIIAENKGKIKQIEEEITKIYSKKHNYETGLKHAEHNFKSTNEDYEKVKEKLKKVKSELENIIVDNETSISREEYDNLCRRDRILTALENGGVDNWEWYGESLSKLEE